MVLEGVTINGKHSLDDYGMYLRHKEIGFPEVKTEYVDVPGTNGLLDFTEVLADHVCYGNRQIRLDFKMKDGRITWEQKINAVAKLHGIIVTLIFDSDPDWFYRGRATVNAWESSKKWGYIRIDVNAEPFRMSVEDESETVI